MSLLDFIVILVYLLILILARFAITPFSLAILVAVLIVVRLLKGERL